MRHICARPRAARTCAKRRMCNSGTGMNGAAGDLRLLKILTGEGVSTFYLPIAASPRRTRDR